MINEELRICVFNMGKIEDEYHFLLVCPNHRDLRKEFASHTFVIGQHERNLKHFSRKQQDLLSQAYPNKYILLVKNTLSTCYLAECHHS